MPNAPDERSLLPLTDGDDYAGPPHSNVVATANTFRRHPTRTPADDVAFRVRARGRPMLEALAPAGMICAVTGTHCIAAFDPEEERAARAGDAVGGGFRLLASQLKLVRAITCSRCGRFEQGPGPGNTILLVPACMCRRGQARY